MVSLKQIQELLEDESVDSLARMSQLFEKDWLPQKLFHSFACDCAERVLLDEVAVGREPNHRSWLGLEQKRRWLRDELDWEAVVVASDDSRQAAHEASVLHCGAEAAAAAADASSDISYWIRSIAWAAEAVEVTAVKGEGEMKREEALQWQLEHLLHLVKEHLGQ